MLENYRSIETLRREMRRLAEVVATEADKVAGGTTGGGDSCGAAGAGIAFEAGSGEAPPFPANEKPPHY